MWCRLLGDLMTEPEDFLNGEQVELYGLNVTYQHTPILQDVSGIFRPGSSTAIFGPNGAGKSTLLKTIMGYVRPRSGRVALQNRKNIAYLPQRNEIDRHFPLTVLDAVSMGLWRRIGALGKVTPSYIKEIEAALKSVGLGSISGELLENLSGGQFQRVLFARLILQDSPLILLDEPFAAMDNQTIHDLSALIQKWHKQGRTIITVLHDIDIVREYFPETLLLARKILAWDETSKILQQKNLMEAHNISRTWDFPVIDEGDI